LNPESIPSITVQELAERMHQNPSLVILDVREPVELSAARIPDSRVAYAPLSVLASSRTPQLPEPALSQDTEIAVLCHLGERSA
jgi:rhodanese-related sulfurtransferase